MSQHTPASFSDLSLATLIGTKILVSMQVKALPVGVSEKELNPLRHSSDGAVAWPWGVTCQEGPVLCVETNGVLLPDLISALGDGWPQHCHS